MAKIFNLKISNFRGIKAFDENFAANNFICFVGRGDSGKSSILEAISLVLSPNYTISIQDSDFYNCDFNNSISIEVSLFDLPSEILNFETFGSLARFLRNDNFVIQDEAVTNSRPVITINLTVEKDLEPQWRVIKGSQVKAIKAVDRAKLGMFLISDYINNHFTFSKGSPLYLLLAQLEKNKGEENVVLDSLRDAKVKIDDKGFEHLKSIIEQVNLSAVKLGIALNRSNATIDCKDLIEKDGKLSLHDNSIPFRLKGKGSKRLISLAIQKALPTNQSIILVDELEQGLEPDRIKHLVRTLFTNNTGQIFLTTHSQAVIEEIECANLFRLKNNSGILSGSFIPEDDKFQSLMRTCPEAIYAEKVIMCEGKTEVGFCRALDMKRKNEELPSFTTKNVVYTCGIGDGFIERAIKLKTLGINVCVLCDSDKDEELNPSKDSLTQNGISIFDWDKNFCFERQIFQDLPWQGILEIVDYQILLKNGDAKYVHQLIQFHLDEVLKVDWRGNDELSVRNAIYKASVYKKEENGKKIDKSWFKRIDHGEAIGNIILKYSASLTEKNLGIKIANLNSWIDD